MLEMDSAPLDGTDVLLFPHFSGARHPHFMCAMRGVVGHYSDVFEVWVLGEEGEFPSTEFTGWRPIGNKWLDPTVVPPIEGVNIILRGTPPLYPAFLWLQWNPAKGVWLSASGNEWPLAMVRWALRPGVYTGWLSLPGEDGP